MYDKALFSDGNLNIYIRFDTDAGDLLHHLGGRVKINHPLVDAHLEAIPGLGALTTRGLTGGDTKGLGGHADWSLHLQLLVLGSSHQFEAHWNKIM